MKQLLCAECYRISHSLGGLALTAILFAQAYLSRQQSRLFSEIDSHYLFYFVLRNPFLLLWSGTLLAAFSFQWCFSNRMFQGALSSGKSRFSTAASHIFPYYFWGILIDRASMLASRQNSDSKILF